ncbi:MAG TPA: hypothetical protein VF910_03530 [Candidatus Bathyarchaeia archaeon]
MAVEKGENRRTIRIPNCMRVNGERWRLGSTLIAKENGTIQIAATAQKENDRPKSLFKDERVNTRNDMKTTDKIGSTNGESRSLTMLSPLLPS